DFDHNFWIPLRCSVCQYAAPPGLAQADRHPTSLEVLATCRFRHFMRQGGSPTVPSRRSTPCARVNLPARWNCDAVAVLDEMLKCTIPDCFLRSGVVASN